MPEELYQNFKIYNSGKSEIMTTFKEFSYKNLISIG